jgi:flagellar basal-body rod protein FlgC
MKIVILSLFILFSSSAFAGSLDEAIMQSTAGMKAQGARMKVVAQNIANATSTGQTPGAEPYRRKLILFKNKIDKNSGYNIVQVDKIKGDRKTKFNAKFDPSHPAANQDGYVLLPNVEPAIENVDMKEAQRGYEANLGAAETSKKMIGSTIDLLR